MLFFMLATLRLKLSNLPRSNEKLMRMVPPTNSQMYLLIQLNFPFQSQTFLTNHLAARIEGCWTWLSGLRRSCLGEDRQVRDTCQLSSKVAADFWRALVLLEWGRECWKGGMRVGYECKEGNWVHGVGTFSGKVVVTHRKWKHCLQDIRGLLRLLCLVRKRARIYLPIKQHRLHNWVFHGTKTHLSWYGLAFFFFPKTLSNLYTQHGVWTYNPKIKSCISTDWASHVPQDFYLLIFFN